MPRLHALSQRAAATCSQADGRACVLSKGERLAAIDLMGRSFAGTTAHDPELTMHWLIGPEMQDREHPHRAPVMTMIMAMGARNNLMPGGVLLGSRVEDGTLGAVLLVRRQRTGRKSHFERLMGGPRFVSSMIWLGANKRIPELFKSQAPEDKALVKTLGAGMKERAKHLKELIDSRHATHAPGVHYYVAIMATDPPSMGQGHCGRLMRVVSRMADAEGVPCYLEASGEKNRRLYEHLGYSVVEQAVLVDDGQPEWKDELFLMVRHSNAIPSSG